MSGLIVRLKGGLGNQMFQYAFGLSMSSKFALPVDFDWRYLEDRSWRPNFVYRNYDLDIFGINKTSFYKKKFSCGDLYFRLLLESVLRRKELALIAKRRGLVFENKFFFEPSILSGPPADYYTGYFQSYKYFQDSGINFRKIFKIVRPPSGEVNQLLERIIQDESVCINVRRTDYVDSKFGVPQIGFYKHAVEKIRCHLKDPKFYIFSDDIEWCSKNFGWCSDSVLVNHSFAGPRFSDYFRLMQSCKHFIIPNSSFAWWCAFLSDYEKKMVFAPKGWHFYLGVDGGRDIILKAWHEVEFCP